MRIFLTGANGWIGSAVAQDLLGAGHSVVGLVRSAEKGETLAAKSVIPLVGSLGDLDILRKAGKRRRRHCPYRRSGWIFRRSPRLSQEESAAIEAFGEVYADDRSEPIIVTGGILLTPPRETFQEDARPSLDPPISASVESRRRSCWQPVA